MQSCIKNYLALLNVQKTMSDYHYISELQQAHLAHFSFSSSNVLLKKALSLQPAALFERLINQRQGGYCFEHNKIFYLALQALGYTVRPLLGRVMLNGDSSNGRSHRLTLLTLAEKQYVIDVGFGVACPRSLIDLQNKEIVNEQAFKYQLSQESDYSISYRLTQLSPEPAKVLYRFDLREVTEADCDIAHFYSHQHPQAAFVNNLVIARVTAKQRQLIRNLTYLIIDNATGQEVVTDIKSSKQLHRLCNEQFAVGLSESAASELFSFLQDKRNYSATSLSNI
ncbi:arylamine N-acetyltransferase [Paraglaciecola sp.]|uniref:arylamine N-acetyltransferase family protein n=1 Tax=Paraglaciecola sp. TaxID=1920173 RepID=UPI0030F37F77